MSASKLILIGGPPYVGKTTAARLLFLGLENCAWLDGDDVWRVHPFRLDDPRLRLSDLNMAFVLKTYLEARFDYVILSSVVLDEPKIAEGILARLGSAQYELLHFSLVCDAAALEARALQRDPGAEPASRFMHAATAAPTIKIDTSGKCPTSVAESLLRHISQDQGG